MPPTGFTPVTNNELNASELIAEGREVVSVSATPTSLSIMTYDNSQLVTLHITLSKDGTLQTCVEFEDMRAEE